MVLCRGEDEGGGGFGWMEACVLLLWAGATEHRGWSESKARALVSECRGVCAWGCGLVPRVNMTGFCGAGVPCCSDLILQVAST